MHPLIYSIPHSSTPSPTRLLLPQLIYFIPHSSNPSPTNLIHPPLFYSIQHSFTLFNTHLFHPALFYFIQHSFTPCNTLLLYPTLLYFILQLFFWFSILLFLYLLFYLILYSSDPPSILHSSIQFNSSIFLSSPPFSPLHYPFPSSSNLFNFHSPQFLPFLHPPPCLLFSFPHSSIQSWMIENYESRSSIWAGGERGEREKYLNNDSNPNMRGENHPLALPLLSLSPCLFHPKPRRFKPSVHQSSPSLPRSHRRVQSCLRLRTRSILQVGIL